MNSKQNTPAQTAVSPKLRRVAVKVGRQKGYEPIALEDQSASVLGVLFKEVLQQIPREMADKMVAAYRAGQPIVAALGECRYEGSKTAFYCAIGSKAWRPGDAILRREFDVESESGTEATLRVRIRYGRLQRDREEGWRKHRPADERLRLDYQLRFR